MNELPRHLVSCILRKKGFNKTVAWGLAQDILNDLFHNKNYTLRKRLWALRKGFLCDKLDFYRLTESNYRDFLSDFDYDWLNPHNGTYSQWIDNKLVFKYILQPFSEFLPEYYFQISKLGVNRLVDCPAGYDATTEGILKLLKNRGNLAAKLMLGAGGLGFYKLSFSNDIYSLNDQPLTPFEILKLIESWRLMDTGYVITEYLTSHNSLRNIWVKSANAVRIGVIRPAGENAKIAFAYLKIGFSSTGMVELFSRGGNDSLVNIQNGNYKNYLRFLDGTAVEFENHPESGVRVEGEIPRWQNIKKKVLEISDFLPQFRFFGMDIVVTQTGFKIIEINPQPAISALQAYIPIHSDTLMHTFFLNLMMEKKKIIESQKMNRKNLAINRLSGIINVRKLVDSFRSGSRTHRLKDNVVLIESSELFNREWYINHYTQVRESGIDPLRHYLTKGGFEGFNPGPEFDSAFYLDLYEDVKQAGMNPLVHYLKYGNYEGRSCVPAGDTGTFHD